MPARATEIIHSYSQFFLPKFLSTAYSRGAYFVWRYLWMRTRHFSCCWKIMFIFSLRIIDTLYVNHILLHFFVLLPLSLSFPHHLRPHTRHSCPCENSWRKWMVFRACLRRSTQIWSTQSGQTVFRMLHNRIAILSRDSVVRPCTHVGCMCRVGHTLKGTGITFIHMIYCDFFYFSGVSALFFRMHNLFRYGKCFFLLVLFLSCAPSNRSNAPK